MGRLINNGRDYSGSNMKLDTTLSVEGQAADAKAVGDAINVKFVSNKEDENYDTIQVKDDEGHWISVYKAYTSRRDLYMTTNNEGKFESFAGGASNGKTTTPEKPTTTFTDKISLSFYKNVNSSVPHGCVISELIDVTRFKKLHLYHTSKASISYGSEGYAKVFVTDAKSTKMTALASVELVYGKGSSGAVSPSTSGEVDLDITNITGECYICVELYLYCYGTNGVSVSTEVSNMYLE